MDKLNILSEASKDQDNTSVSELSQNISACNHEALAVFDEKVGTNGRKDAEESNETPLQSQSASLILQWEEEAKSRAVKQIAGMLRRPEQLEKVCLKLVAQNCQ